MSDRVNPLVPQAHRAFPVRGGEQNMLQAVAALLGHSAVERNKEFSFGLVVERIGLVCCPQATNGFLRATALLFQHILVF